MGLGERGVLGDGVETLQILAHLEALPVEDEAPRVELLDEIHRPIVLERGDVSP